MAYTVIKTDFPEVLILEPQVFGDSRGFFFESFNAEHFHQATGVNVTFVQDNHSKSTKNVLRGLHYQIEHPQGKLVRVLTGVIFDVVVDLRRSSPRFGQWVGIELSEKNKRQVWIPPGFAHGFLAVSDTAEMLYKTTDYWYLEHERSLLWNDPIVGIKWPIIEVPTLSAKDASANGLQSAEVYK